MNPITLKKAATTWLLEAVAVILVVIALRKGNPYGYYVFLRWMTCPIFTWITWKAYSRGNGLLLAIAAGILAVLFNPVLRVMLDRGIWEILNIAMIAVAIWSAAVSIKSTKEQT
jgi:FtsH-binding integral membrane protein